MNPSLQVFAVSFVKGSQIVGNAKWPYQYSHEKAHVPYSVAYFCPKCGDIWARIVVHENSDDWSLSHVTCQKHTTKLSLLAGGTIFRPLLQENFDIPKHILAEDFLFLMTLFDKIAGSYET